MLKFLAKIWPGIQKLYQISYILCNPLWSFFVQSSDTNLFVPRGTLGFQCICRAQLIIPTTHLHCCLPCNYVKSLLAYCRGQLRINRYIYCIKVQLRYFNSSVNKLLNLQTSFPSIYSNWKDKTPIISTETVRMVTNISTSFLQIQSIFIASKKKKKIFVFRRPWSREKKLLIFRMSRKTFTKNTKTISNYMYLH